MEESRNKAKMNWFQQIGDVGVMSKRDLQTQWEVVQRCHIVRWCGGSMSLEDKVQRHPKEDNRCVRGNFGSDEGENYPLVST
jgi:hypothetical protein